MELQILKKGEKKKARKLILENIKPVFQLQLDIIENRLYAFSVKTFLKILLNWTLFTFSLKIFKVQITIYIGQK